MTTCKITLMWHLCKNMLKIQHSYFVANLVQTIVVLFLYRIVQFFFVKVKWRVAKYSGLYSEFVLFI